MNPHMGWAIRGFQNSVYQCITVRQPQRRLDGIWNYHSLEEAMRGAGLEEVKAYVLRKNNLVA